MKKSNPDEHLCPVCNKFLFEAHNSFDICDICDWMDDAIQNKDPDYEGGGNRMSLNQAREAYRKGEQIH